MNEMNGELLIPHDAKLESWIIGAMFFEPKCIEDIYKVVSMNDFYFDDHRLIVKKIYELWNEDIKKVNFVSMVPLCEERGIEYNYLLKITEQIPTVEGIEMQANRLKQLSNVRRLIRLGHKLTMANRIREEDEIRQVLADTQREIEAISNDVTQTETLKSMKEIMEIFEQKFNERLSSPNRIRGLGTGIEKLDYMTAGLQDGDLIIIGGRPSVGKTAFVLKLVEEISLVKKLPVVLFSLEMNFLSLAERIIAMTGPIQKQSLRTGLLDDGRVSLVRNIIHELSDGTLFIDDQSVITISEIKAKCRRLQRESGLNLIVIDYLGLIKPENKLSNRYEDVSQIVRDLKALAKELNVPLIALSQLNRGLEGRKEKRPTLADLRETGEIEQTADVVGLLYRDSYYQDKEEEKKKDKFEYSVEMEFIVAKQRNGPVGTIKFDFYRETNKFIEK